MLLKFFSHDLEFLFGAYLNGKISPSHLFLWSIVSLQWLFSSLNTDAKDLVKVTREIFWHIAFLVRKGDVYLHSSLIAKKKKNCFQVRGDALQGRPIKWSSRSSHPFFSVLNYFLLHLYQYKTSGNVFIGMRFYRKKIIKIFHVFFFLMGQIKIPASKN